MFGLLLSWFTGGGLTGLADQLRRAHEAKLMAQTSAQKLEADHDIKRLDNAIRAIEAANDDRWSATSMGRYLIVVPYGIWWALTFLDSTFAFTWNTLEPPAYILRMADFMVPAIIIGDIGKSAVRQLGRRG